MGCGKSSSYEELYTEIPNNWMKLFLTLKIKEYDVIRLYKLFKSIDKNNNGFIDIDEFIKLIAMEYSMFIQHIFNIFDRNHSGQIDFREFVLGLWNYCTLTDEPLLQFIFELYNLDHDDHLSAKEIHNMFKELYGKELEHNPDIKMNEKIVLTLEYNKLLDLNEFKILHNENKSILKPAFHLRNELQTYVLGKSFWNSMLNKRLELCSTSKHIANSQLYDSMNAILLKYCQHDYSILDGIISKENISNKQIKMKLNSSKKNSPNTSAKSEKDKFGSTKDNSSDSKSVSSRDSSNKNTILTHKARSKPQNSINVKSLLDNNIAKILATK